jgi:hypothetical protein
MKTIAKRVVRIWRSGVVSGKVRRWCGIRAAPDVHERSRALYCVSAVEMLTETALTGMTYNSTTA